MVHVKKCPLTIKNKTHPRGKATTEFYHDGKPQIYCEGFVDCYNDEPLEECKHCADWVYGGQCEKDFEAHLEQIKEQENEN